MGKDHTVGHTDSRKEVYVSNHGPTYTVDVPTVPGTGGNGEGLGGVVHESSSSEIQQAQQNNQK